jgi:hypothetical protein
MKKPMRAAFAALLLAHAMAPLLVACERHKTVGEKIEEAGEEIGDEIDDHTTDSD